MPFLSPTSAKPNHWTSSFLQPSPILENDIIYLCFRVWSGPPQNTAATQFGHLSVQSMSEHHSQRHALVGLVRSVAKHQTLITGPDVFLRSTDVDTLGNIGRLFFQSQQHVARFVVKPYHQYKQCEVVKTQHCQQRSTSFIAI